MARTPSARFGDALLEGAPLDLTLRDDDSDLVDRPRRIDR